MKDKTDKDIEQILLNDENYEKFLSEKIENEFNSMLSDAGRVQHEKITEIKKLSKSELFSKRATYVVINKNSKTKSYINGVQAEGFLGDRNAIREKLLSGQTDSFVNDEYYIKFCSYEK